MIRLLPVLTLLLLALAGPAAAMVRLPESPVPIAGNPADRLLSLPVEDSSRCERWGKGQASLHAENRAKLKRKLNATVAHRDHVHLGMTKRGAAGRTSFWSRGL